MRASKTDNDLFHESYSGPPFEPPSPGSKTRTDAPQAVNQDGCIRRDEVRM
jgi:hypothetical protein